MPEVLLDAAGRPRSPATVPGYHAGRSPRDKGQHYPADPPTIGEIVAVMRHAGSDVYGARLRALIVPLIVIQRHLGRTNLGITSIYLPGIDSTEIIDTVHARRPPMVPVDATLRL
jgi:hypothetical protein